MLQFVSGLLSVSLLASIASASAASAGAPWLDASLPIPARVAALLPQLTLEEKLHQLQRASFPWNATALAGTGVGMLECGGLDLSHGPSGFAESRNRAVSAILSAGPGARLGLPPSFRTLATHGGEAFGTVMPQGPALGATWDVSLVRELAAAGAAEARALGIDLTTFVIHMVADARFGRQEEGFSEEPTLTAAMGVACVVGSQGAALTAPNDYVLSPSAPALFKHLGAYGSPAGGQNGGRADAPEHTVREVHLKPWRAVAAAGARGVMPSHNTVLNTPAHGNAWLLTDVLRGEFSMAGLFLSDTGDVAALGDYRLCDDDASCAALALSAGVDVEQPPGTTYLSLPLAVERGLINASLIDAAVARVLTHKFSAGLFDSPLVDPSAADAVVNSPPHRTLARAAAAEGAVLLVNNITQGGSPTLPLPQTGTQRVAVIGPLGGCVPADANCEARSALLGNYAGTGPPPASGVPTVFEAIGTLGFARSITYTQGARIETPETDLIPEAVAAASAADVVVLVVGDSLVSCGESIDRDSLDLPGGQLALLAALVAADLAAPIVVVLVNGRTATFGAADGNVLLNGVSALLVTWRPGQEGAAAIADLLYGIVNPSGRLPMQWLRSASQAQSGASPWLQERTARFDGSVGAEGRGYGRYWASLNPASPLFSFGEGLSYGTFTVGSLTVAAQPGNATHPFVAHARVSLSADGAAGVCVVQLYVQDPVGSSGRIVRPWKRLLAFTRVAVAPGGESDAVLPIAAADLALVDDHMALTIASGNYTLSVGTSSIADGGPGQIAMLHVSPSSALAAAAALAVQRVRADGAAAA